MGAVYKVDQGAGLALLIGNEQILSTCNQLELCADKFIFKREEK